jgi:hypothetical protein
MTIDYSDPVDLSWKLISYLSLEAEEQIALIGPANQWFCEEDKDRNPGANYICGVVCAFSTFRNTFADELNLLESSALFELDAVLDLMLADHRESRYWWTVEELRNGAVWRLVRRLARITLTEAALDVNAPAEPFWHESLFDVDGYQIKPLPAE